jgi:hypothetical protein
MLFFYLKDEPIPINIFHPRWLIDGPFVFYKPWNLRIDNHDYSKDKPNEDRFADDRAARAGEQLIYNTALSIVKKHKNLPPGEKENFALAFKKVNDTLAERQDEKLDRLQRFPRRLPNPIIQPKLKHLPRRKRALTGAETAALMEKEQARERRRA